jgi:glycosyltransferase involved in cell wall biosynthesis
MNINSITIVIVSYYRGSRLNKCLDTLKNIPNIIVWDNNTTGEELEKVKLAEQNHPNVKFIYSNENVGLTKAWNQGIIQSETDWVLLTCDDMLFDEDWFDVLNNILDEKPHLEQIHLNAWNAVVFHKQTIVRMGWWDERYRYYPSMEDDDWYLRTVEELGYSPYGTYAKHFNFPKEYIKGLQPYLNKKEKLFHQQDNFTYYCTSEYSNHKVIGLSTITGQEDDAGSRNNSEGSMDKGNNLNGIEFHHMKWEPINNPYMLEQEGILLGKDGRIWKRNYPELDFYPEIRNEYAKKYFNINLYED